MSERLFRLWECSRLEQEDVQRSREALMMCWSGFGYRVESLGQRGS